MTATTTVSFRLPDLGEGVAESEIVRWLVAPGDELVEDQPMVEVMTDKATVEIPAPVAGTVKTLCADDGQVVPVGSVIVEIEADEAAAAAAARADVRDAAPAAPDRGVASAPRAQGAPTDRAARVQATPLVRRLAQELGVDLTTVVGTGPKGRITEDDVRAVEGPTAPQAESGVRREPLVGMRRAIAQHLAAAAQVPTVTVVEEADLSAVERVRHAAGHSYLPFVIKAVIGGLREVPRLNAVMSADGGTLQIHDAIHLGIAVQTQHGLVVPVLRNADSLGVDELANQVEALAERATAGTLRPDELRGSTFTITSAGKFGGLFTNPLLNVPEVGIFGLHRAEDRPVVVDGEVEIRRCANLSVTFDHRAVDGVDASRFLLHVIGTLRDL